MKQSILKKPSQLMQDNESVVSSVSNTTSIMRPSASLTNSNSNQTPGTSKNVRFLGIDYSDGSVHSDQTEFFNGNQRSSSGFVGSSFKNYYRKSKTIPLKQFNIYTKPDEEYTVLYQQPNKLNQNQIYNINYNSQHHHNQPNQQQLPFQNINQGFRISSALLENRNSKSGNPFKKSSIEVFQATKIAPNATPTRPPVQINNFVTSSSNKSSSKFTTEDNPTSNNYYYYKRLNQSLTNIANNSTTSTLNIINFTNNPNNGSISTPIKASTVRYKLKSSNHRIGSSVDSSNSNLYLPVSEHSNNRISENSPNTTPRNSESVDLARKQMNIKKTTSSPSLTLYSYLLQTNKGSAKEVKASVIRSQTKRLISDENVKFQKQHDEPGVTTQIEKLNFNKNDDSSSNKINRSSSATSLLHLTDGGSLIRSNTTMSRSTNHLSHSNFKLINANINI